MVLPLYSTIEKLDRSFLEASLDLGATQAKTFWNVTLPLTMPGVVTGIILVFIPCLGTFLISDRLGGPNDVTIANTIEQQFLEANNWPFGSGAVLHPDVCHLHRADDPRLPGQALDWGGRMSRQLKPGQSPLGLRAPPLDDRAVHR